MSTKKPAEKKPHPSLRRPRDAATLLIVRGNEEVLMGVRNSKHAFMPNKYVFPGGSVDRADSMVPRPVDLHPDVAEKLERGCGVARARALAMAAVRETFEETSLILGHSADEVIKTRSQSWRPFYETGHIPAIDRVEYIARAITPPRRPRRFDTRFFLVHAEDCTGDVDGNGELLDLKWVPLREAHQLDLPNITQHIVELAKQRLEDREHLRAGAPIPFARMMKGRHQMGEH